MTGGTNLVVEVSVGFQMVESDLKSQIRNLKFEISDWTVVGSFDGRPAPRPVFHQSLITGHQSLALTLATAGLEPHQKRAKNFPKKINRGAQLRGRSSPVFPVRLRRWRARLGLRGVFVAAQKFVSFNLGYHPDAARLVDFGALDASQAANLYGSGESDFMGQR